VDRAAGLRVFFDRPLFPRDVHRGHVAVQSGTRGVYLQLRFDPVERVLSVAHDALLDPEVVYRLEVEGMRDLDGHAMAEPFVATFTTGARAEGDPPAAPRPGWADVAPIFDRCAANGCHGGDRPVLGLDLSSGAAVRRTAIGVVAEQSRRGVQGDEPWRGADTLAGLARIDVVAGVGRPSRSYLLYKALGDPHAAGDPMPPPPAEPLAGPQLRLLSDWILAGAPTD
jgi:hypothetical protein